MPRIFIKSYTLLPLCLMLFYGANSTAEVIIDNTANITKIGVSSSLSTLGSMDNKSTYTCTKFDTLNQKNANCFSRYGVKVTQPENPTTTRDLKIDVGVDQMIANIQTDGDPNGGKDLFAGDYYLFDIEKFRIAADNLATLPPTVDAPAGTYGTITFQQFLNNVNDSRPMYGLIRVKLPLELQPIPSKTVDNQNPNLNALGQTVSQLYGYCKSNTHLCTCPIGNITRKQDVAWWQSHSLSTISFTPCGMQLNNTAKIIVYGSLMFDFVDYRTEEPITMAGYPYSTRANYWQINVPVLVNPALDANLDGVMDIMSSIASFTSGAACGYNVFACSVSPNSIPTYSDLNSDVKTTYLNKTGVVLTQAIFDTLGSADKYHSLFPTGYAKGWVKAFAALSITPEYWRSLGFDMDDPAGGRTYPNESDIFQREFEDIPTYMYTGGLVDMHNHANVSGLVYAPQAMELEQVYAGTRQYFIGGIVVKDAFVLVDTDSSMTLISGDPESFSNIKLSEQAQLANIESGSTGIEFSRYSSHNTGLTTPQTGGGGSTSTDLNTDPSGTPTTDPNGNPGSVVTTRNSQWIEVVPQ